MTSIEPRQQHGVWLQAAKPKEPVDLKKLTVRQYLEATVVSVLLKGMQVSHVTELACMLIESLWKVHVLGAHYLKKNRAFLPLKKLQCSRRECES